MKSKKLMVIGALFLGVITVAVIFSGTFGEWHPEARSELIGWVAEDGTLLDLDGHPISEENEEELIAQAVLEEQQLMANPPRFEISANEVQAMIDAVNLSDDFEFELDAQGTAPVGLIMIMMDSVNPLADSALMSEFEQVTTLILAALDVDYPQNEIERMMRTVFETEAVGDFIWLTDAIQIEFLTFGDGSIFSISAQQPNR